MKVILNLHPLGGQARTGIYRVVDHLVRGLARELSSDLSVHSIAHTYYSSNYFQNHLSATGCKFILNGVSRILLPISKILESFVQETMHNRSLVYRVGRKFASTIQHPLDFLASGIPASLLGKAQIYHSPVANAPNFIRRSGCKRFTTIYDLIAITHPEYFEQYTIDAITEIIGHLDAEDYTLSISEATRDALLKHSKCSPERAFVVPLAASDFFYPASDLEKNLGILQKYEIPEPGFILSLCTFEIRKNIETAILAFAKLHENKSIPPNTKLVLVGGKGWKTQNIETALAAAGEFRDQILMPGFIPDEDLATIYSSAKVFVYMSLLEGFGLPPLEAMQCGTPVITSNSSSLPEVVGEGGTMLEPTDVYGLCQAIQRLYHDPSFHREMSERALDRSRHFSWEKFISGTLDVYRIALGRN